MEDVSILPPEDKQTLAREYKREWRKKNKEYIKQYQQEYLQKNNEMCVCSSCHATYKKYGKILHETTKRHITYIKMVELENKIKTLEQTLFDYKKV